MKSHLQSLLTAGQRRRARRLPDLGQREQLALELLWRAGAATAIDLHAQMRREAVSLSTVQSTLERLHRKQLVNREKSGRAYVYRPVIDRTELISGLLKDIAEDIAAGDPGAMLSGFIGYVANEDPEMVNELADAIERARSTPALSDGAEVNDDD